MLLESGDEATKTRRILKKRMLMVGRRLMVIVETHGESPTGDEEEMEWACV